MSTYQLDKLLAPQSVALVGASPREHSLGRHVLTNLRASGFAGDIFLVNPKYAQIDGFVVAPDIGSLAATPDVVIVACPPDGVRDVVEAAGRRGVAAAIILTAGLGHGPESLAEAVRLEARRHGIRLVGPNCLGLMAPRAKLNATFAAHGALPGHLALVSQSGAVAAAMVEWAAARQVGFSAVVSLGDMVDVDFGDCLDFFAADPATQTILLYVESVTDVRKFMSAARAAARVKPVIAIKAGRHATGARAAATHTGALAGSDEVYDAAFRRAGLLRVVDLDEMFAAAATLSRQKPFPGNRLAVLTNGGGLGVLAVDRLADLGGTLAQLDPETIARLDGALPRTWSHANPVDIVGDADATRYAGAIDALMQDRASDAILIMHVATALADASASAAAVRDVVKRYRVAGARGKPVFAVWLDSGGAASRILDDAGIPSFDTEADAIRGFMHLVRYRELQDALLATPDSLPQALVPDTTAARAIVDRALQDGRTWLDPLEVVSLLEAYRIPITSLTLAADPEQAAIAARPLLANGDRVAVKIMSVDIVHKSDVGGVALDLASEEAVRNAATTILARATAAKPGARFGGVTVQRMVHRPRANELIAGLADDPTFGPIIVFGRGGTAVEIAPDKALTLPPIDLRLARELVANTRISRRLAGYRDVPAANAAAIERVLVMLAQLAADLPEVRELDINPLLADAEGVMAVDARVAVAPLQPGARRAATNPRFALRPYPKEWERRLVTRSGDRFLVRPLRPDDEEPLGAFLRRVSRDDFRMRFFSPVRDPDHAFLARLVHLDYARAIAFVALDEDTGAFAGVVRLHADVNHDTAEYAILVRSDLKGRGLGWELMHHGLAWARAEGIRRIHGEVLAENGPMLKICRELGFKIEPEPADPQIRRVTFEMANAAASP
jgi:acetyltransferase